MVLFWILQRWRLGVSSSVRLGVSSSVRLGGVGIGQRPLATVVAEKPRDRFVFLDFLGFYL
jgi:hypothetical protein